MSVDACARGDKIVPRQVVARIRNVLHWSDIAVTRAPHDVVLRGQWKRVDEGTGGRDLRYIQNLLAAHRPGGLNVFGKGCVGITYVLGYRELRAERCGDLEL